MLTNFLRLGSALVLAEGGLRAALAGHVQKQGAQGRGRAAAPDRDRAAQQVLVLAVGKGQGDLPGDQVEVERAQEHLVAPLVAADEQAVLCGLFEEAQLWDGRYKDSLKIALRKKGAMSVKARRWF